MYHVMLPALLYGAFGLEQQPFLNVLTFIVWALRMKNCLRAEQAFFLRRSGGRREVGCTCARSAKTSGSATTGR